MKTPNSATNLGKAIKRYCGKGRDDIRLARAMRNADSVLATVDEAVAWTNKLIERIVAS